MLFALNTFNITLNGNKNIMPLSCYYEAEHRFLCTVKTVFD